MQYFYKIKRNTKLNHIKSDSLNPGFKKHEIRNETSNITKSIDVNEL